MYEHMNYDIWLTNEHEILLPHFITFTFDLFVDLFQPGACNW